MDWVLRRLADRLGVEPARAGELITPHLRFEQPWKQVATVAVLLGAAALIIWLYRREGSAPMWYKMTLATIRIILVALAVFMLSEAVLSVERTGLPYFVVMLDDSASAGIADQYADPKTATALQVLARGAGKSEVTRLAVAQGWLAQDRGRLLRDLQKNHKIKPYLVASTARALDEIDTPEKVDAVLKQLLAAEPTGTQSRLGDGVANVLTALQGVPPTAILLLTDGQTTDGEPLAKVAEAAGRKGVPIFTLGLGDPEPARDLELSDLQVDEVVFVDDLVPFQARLNSRGFAGQQVKVSLKEKGPGGAIKEIATIPVQAPPDGEPKRVEISHRPTEVGEITYILEVEPRERELQKENNRIERTIQVRKERLKVLLVEGQPRFEFRYLKNFLERDETVDLGVVLQSADPEYSEQDRSALSNFPAAKEGKDGLYSYDVIVFGDADPGFFSATQLANVRDFVVEKGGGLLFVAGEDFNPLSYKGTPLETLLPIQLADARNPAAVGNAIAPFRPTLTVEGRTHPIFRFGEDEATSARVWESLPMLFWILEAPRKQPAAFVLAEHPTLKGADGPLPVLLYQFVGAGKTMFSAVDDTWRWRMRVGDRYFGRFWLQSLRFLARSKLAGQKQAELMTDRRRYQRGQPVQVRVRFPNPGLAPTTGEVAVEVDRKGQAPRRLTLKASPTARNMFEGALPQASEGEYEVRLLPPPVLEGGLPRWMFRVDPPAGEFEHVPMNEPELIRAAKASGGRFYTPTTAATLYKDLPKPQKVPLDTDPPIALWNTWPMLGLFVGLLTTEWALRKRKQMV
ncbi:MAG TPA: hypothetical protein VG406_07275 [Isosphaeraceae bacterium]|nr:hypothetical protein [Isosphaeraceae bacterium]